MSQEKLNNAIKIITEIASTQPENADAIKERLEKLLFIYKFPEYHKNNPDDPLSNFPKTQNEIERKRVDDRLRGFSLKDSIAWKAICERFGSDLNQTELLSMAEVIGHELHIKIDREAKRRKEVLIKWFDENFLIIKPILNIMVLEDANGNKIDPKSM